jgi:hypothetical protein
LKCCTALPPPLFIFKQASKLAENNRATEYGWFANERVSSVVLLFPVFQAQACLRLRVLRKTARRRSQLSQAAEAFTPLNRAEKAIGL